MTTPMTFALSDEQQLLRDSFIAYLQDRCTFEHFRAARREPTGFDAARWREFAELGWLALPFAERDDGLGGGPVETALLFEAIGRHLVPEPYLETILLAGGLLEHASAATRTRWLPGIIAGETHGALAWAESRHTQDWQYVTVRAQRHGSGWRLYGSKCHVSNARGADVFIVSARIDGEARDCDGIALFVVPATSAGLTRRDYRSFDGGTAADLQFDGVPLDADALLGDETSGAMLLEHAIDRAQLALCAEAVGLMTHLQQATVNYTRERRQFGQPIAKFQVLQHRMADMYMALELTQSLLWAAVQANADDSDDAPYLLAALRVKIGRALRFIGHNAIQLHGGIAMTDELDIGHYFKRLTLIENLFGTTEIYLRRFAVLSDERRATSGVGMSHFNRTSLRARRFNKKH